MDAYNDYRTLAISEGMTLPGVLALAEKIESKQPRNGWTGISPYTVYDACGERKPHYDYHDGKLSEVPELESGDDSGMGES